MFNKKITWMMIGGGAVLAITIGIVAILAAPYTAQARSIIDEGLRPAQPPGFSLQSDLPGGFAHRGGGRFPGARLPGRDVDGGEYPAEALGITIDELNAAREAAYLKAVDQALSEGLITESQAEMLKERDRGVLGRGFMLGGLFIPKDAIDYQALLAKELNISVEELQSARERASELAIQAKIDSGLITEEQAELFKAKEALKGYIDRESIFTDVTGLSREEFQSTMKEAYEAAIDAAVADGIITQEQAELLLNPEFGFFLDGFGKRFPGHGGFKGFPGNFTPEAFENDL